MTDTVSSPQQDAADKKGEEPQIPNRPDQIPIKKEEVEVKTNGANAVADPTSTSAAAPAQINTPPVKASPEQAPVPAPVPVPAPPNAIPYPTTTSKNKKAATTENLELLGSLKMIHRKHFQCPLCLDPLKDPCIIPACLHRFCSECLRRRWNNNYVGNQCPTCNLTVMTESVRLDTQYRSLVSVSPRQYEDLRLHVVCVSIWSVTPFD